MFDPIIVDNFFANPDVIRDYALKQSFWHSDYDPNNANYPGKRSDFISALNPDIFQELMGGVHDAVGIDRSASTFTHSFFQYCNVEDGNSWVHRDSLYFEPTHVGLVYLTPNPPKNSGTILYDHKDPNYVKGDPQDDSGDVDDYNVREVIDNKYNRLVIYDPDEFHKSDKYFGTTKEDGRLFIVFFMRKN